MNHALFLTKITLVVCFSSNLFCADDNSNSGIPFLDGDYSWNYGNNFSAQQPVPPAHEQSYDSSFSSSSYFHTSSSLQFNAPTSQLVPPSLEKRSPVRRKKQSSGKKSHPSVNSHGFQRSQFCTDEELDTVEIFNSSYPHSSSTSSLHLPTSSSSRRSHNSSLHQEPAYDFRNDGSEYEQQDFENDHDFEIKRAERDFKVSENKALSETAQADCLLKKVSEEVVKLKAISEEIAQQHAALMSHLLVIQGSIVTLGVRQDYMNRHIAEQMKILYNRLAMIESRGIPNSQPTKSVVGGKRKNADNDGGNKKSKPDTENEGN